MGSVTASAMVDSWSNYFSRWGIPRAITTDNRPQLVSSEFHRTWLPGAYPMYTQAFYHPQANGGVEKFNQSLKNGIRAHLAQVSHLRMLSPQTLMQYRATQHATTGVSPLPVSCLAGELELPLSRLHPPHQLPVKHFDFGHGFIKHQRNMRGPV